MLFSQQLVNHGCDFESGNQNMWGPSFSAFTIDQNIELFNFPWNVSYNSGSSGIVSILGQQFGAGIAAGTQGYIRMDFSLEGFTTGELAVKYPVDVELDMTADLTYNQGDLVKINTSYTVADSFELKTLYPSLGTAKLDLGMQVGANASITVCAFSCLTVPIIPSFTSPAITLNIFNLSAAGVYFLGPACAEAIPYYSANAGPGGVGEPSPGQNVFPFALPLYEDGCTAIPWQVHFPLLPLDLGSVCSICGDYGIGGEFTIPYVETQDSLFPNNTIVATGDSNYVTLELEIFKLVGHILAESNIPYASQVGQVLENLSNDFTLPSPLGTIYGATLSYNIMSASFQMEIYNKQKFNFDPKIYGKFDFPVPVEYSIYNSSGVLQTSGTSAIVNCQIGNEIRYKYPCYFADLAITPTYTIVGQISNRTYDSISFTFNFSALAFGFNLPAIQITPQIDIPEICINIPYPCPSWSKPWRWCSYRACTPAFSIPAVRFNGFSLNVGPLFSTSIQLADLQYNWFSDTWNLEGFTPIMHPAFLMKARIFSALASNTNIDCHGGNTGTVTSSTVNGSSPFSYLWTNGAITQNISALTANNYVVTITDANGCQTSTGATVTQPYSPLAIDLVSFNDKSCNGGVNDGAITVSTYGGTTPYNFAWSNLATTENISGISDGTYTLNVSDSKGCLASLTQTLTVPTPLVQSAIVTDAKCFGGNDGEITGAAAGGSAPYNYSWSNGSVSNTILNLTAGNNTLTVTDDKSCTSVAIYTVGQPLTYPSVAIAATAVNCYGGSNANIDVTPAGGTPGYTFVWSNANNELIPNTTEDLFGLPKGTYNVQATDANGCSTSNSITIVQPLAPLSASATLTNINCFGQATGAINQTVIGGTAPYAYLWSNGATTQSLSAIASGVYTVNIVDNNGCTAIYSYTLTQPSAPITGTSSATNVNCNGGNNGTVSSVINGGTLPYTYIWSNGGNTANINTLTAGNYTLTLNDAKGCSFNLSQIVTEPVAPLTASNTVVNVGCFGASTGSVDVTVAGGTLPYNYQWWNQTNQFMSEVTQDLVNKPIGTYTVVITDSKGCEISTVANVIQPSAPLNIAHIMDDVDCNGGTSGALDLTTTGGTSPYSFSWVSGQSTEDISGIAAGSYSVTTTDNNGCTLSKTMEVTEPISPLSTSLQANEIKCNGNATGEVTSATQGGTAPYTYAWSNGSSSMSIGNVVAGIYSLTVTDSKGCFTFTGATVTEPANALNTVPTITDASCYSYSDGKIQLAVTGGTQPYTFSWSNNNAVILNNPSETLGNLPASDYLVRIKDKNQCEWEQLITVGQPMPFVATTTPTPALCFNNPSGSVDLTVTGGTTPYSYSWSNSATSQNISNVLAGIYTVSVTDAQGCIVRDSSRVTQPIDIYISSVIQPISCIDQMDAAINLTTSGGVQPYVYSWSNGAVTQDIAGLIEGTYLFTVTDANGCQKMQSYIIYPEEKECVNPVNTFTPNGDNYNDTWFIENLDLYPSATVQVFNKWGNEVHSQEGVYVPWDGTFEGQPLPADVYYYIILLNNGQENKYTGSITIIR